MTVNKRGWRIFAAIGLLCTIIHVTPASAATDDWTTSLHDYNRDATSADTTFSVANANQMKVGWSDKTGGPIAASPTVSGGVAYFGSWDGNEYAVNAVTGAVLWKTNLGITTANPICIPPQLGVSSPATVQNGVVYVGGGDSYWYALNASTGAVEWRVFTGDNSATGGHYNWSGPLIYNGYAYIGVASLGDCPLVQGQLLQVSLSSHTIVNTLNIVPNGQVGGGIWTSPALDTSTNTIYLDTGTKNAQSQQDAQALLAVDAGTLEIKDHWELPAVDAVTDSDFGTSTMLFTDENGRKMVAAINKNGIVYAFNRSNMSAGPVWQQQIAVGGDCPTCGESSVSSGASGGGLLYFGGGQGQIGVQGYEGTVRALDPATGNVVWQHASPGTVIGALSYANGLVFAGAGSVFEAFNSASGNTMYSFDTGAQIYAGPSVAEGMVYTGNTAGNAYAFTLGNLPQPGIDPNCPSGFTCQDIGGAAPAGSESVSGGTWNIQAGGNGLTGGADSLRLMSMPVTGDGDVQLSAQITSLKNTSAGAIAGLILRQDNTGSSPFYAVVVNPANQIEVLDRTAYGQTVNTLALQADSGLPQYLMIQRSVNTISAAISSNGSSWSLVPGSTATMVMPAASQVGLAASSGANGTGGTATVTNLSIGPVSANPIPAGSGACPSGWSCEDVGNPGVTGSQSLNNGVWTINGAGGDIWEDTDQFHFVSQTISGDGSISAQITSQTNTSPYAKAGVMIRQDGSANAAYYAAYVTPGGIFVQYRPTSGWPAQTAAQINGNTPAYLQVARSGDTLTAYTSTNGTSWVPITGSSVAIPNIAGTAKAGLAITSHNTGTLGSATMGNVAVANTAPPPPNLCPSSWTCQDVGFATPAGSQQLSNGSWTVTSGGGDIWSNYDQFRLISQNLNGDGSVSAQLSSQTDTGSWAKAGVMLRLSNDPGAPYYAVFATPSNGIVVQWRTTQSATTAQIGISGVVPVYLKATRTGDGFTAYTSANGVSWTAIPNSVETIPALSGTLLAGMAADSYDPTNANTTIWNSVNVMSQGGGGGLPFPWTDADVDGSSPAGHATYLNNTFSVSGGGNDIWGSDDESNYVNQPLNGDGTIIARVTSQQNTSSWAKSGIMIQQSTAAGSPYAAIMVTPGNGIHFQSAFKNDQGGGAYTFPNAYLRLVRVGNLFTAYSSGDGTNWQQVGQTTINMSTNATIGLFVDAHDGSSALNTSTFDSVEVIPGGGALPAPWTSNVIGSELLPGSGSYSNGVFTVSGSGDDIWGADDDFQFVNEALTGDGYIVARLTSQDMTDPYAKSGVMIKSSLTSGSPYAAVMATPGNGIHMQANFNQDIAGGGFGYPVWLKLQRSGSLVTTYESTDGQNWSSIGSTTVSLGSTAYIGLFVCAHNPTELNQSTFDNVSVTPTSPPPNGWSDTDVGSPAIAGSAGLNGNVFTVDGNGSDIWQSADQFNYAYQSISGNEQIVARVSGQQDTDSWAKSGIMIKQSTTSGSNYVNLFVTPGNGVHMQQNFNSDWAGSVSVAPVWLKLVKTGNTISGYQSGDGSTWSQVGPTVTESLTDPIKIGLFVCSHNVNELNASTFDNVSISP